jgi:hypothetical protein
MILAIFDKLIYPVWVDFCDYLIIAVLCWGRQQFELAFFHSKHRAISRTTGQALEIAVIAEMDFYATGEPSRSGDIGQRYVFGLILIPHRCPETGTCVCFGFVTPMTLIHLFSGQHLVSNLVHEIAVPGVADRLITDVLFCGHGTAWCDHARGSYHGIIKRIYTKGFVG